MSPPAAMIAQTTWFARVRIAAGTPIERRDPAGVAARIRAPVSAGSGLRDAGLPS
ncbi:MAG: hypothetical protein IT460_08140 [Planctomycetes bacterium]|nr:hypothetical protein [Planctomycetota bacterium]